MNPQVSSIVGMFLVMILAGCVGGPADEDGAQVLAEGEGAILGLLVDDRFRPLHLTDAPQSEFQVAGFVLLQETGEQVQTNDNGEFQFIGVPPATYTLRATVEGHETPPLEVVVEEGEASEATIIARRVINDQRSVITEEWTVFVPCVLSILVSEYNFDCAPDLSGDTFRYGHTTNYTSLGDDASWLVTEMWANQGGAYLVDVSSFEGDRVRYQTVRESDTDYIRIANEYGVINEEADLHGSAQAWTNEKPLTTQLFPGGPFEKEIQDAWPSNGVYDPCCGVGLRAGIQAKFVQSIFVGEPDVDMRTYCVLCRT